MSYEGYEEYLCTNGHLRIFDCWEPSLLEGESEASRCNCGASFVFHHSVNETNGIIEDDPSTKSYPYEVDVPAEFHTCVCGNKHIVKEVQYKIPTKV
jgi:hypothetical protein